MTDEKDLINLDAEIVREGSGDQKRILDFITQFQQLMMHYESAIKVVTMRLEILESEDRANGWHPTVRNVTSRIKEPGSISRKLQRLHLAVSMANMEEYLYDVAGVRVVCSYLSDIYRVRNLLLSSPAFKLQREKDYIKRPKPNGYRSLHLIVNVPVPMIDGTKYVKCEIQLRTTAMDSWAALEHQMRYKKDIPYNVKMDDELKKCADQLFETDRKMQEIAEELGLFTKDKMN